MSIDFADVVKGGEAAFPQEEFAGRVERARAVLESRGIDVLLVTGPENIFYLTGQQTPGYYTYQALLLPVDGEPVFILRQLEVLNLVANSFLDRIEPYPDNADPVDVTVDAIRRAGWARMRIAVDERAWFMPIAIYKALLAELGDLVDGSGAIEQLRAVKSPSEIAKLEEQRRLRRRRDAGGTRGGASGRDRERPRLRDDGRRHRRRLGVRRHGAAGVGRAAIRRAARHLAPAQAPARRAGVPRARGEPRSLITRRSCARRGSARRPTRRAG